MHRIALTVACAAALLSTTSVAMAGGFAVTTLDSMPRPVVAGQTYHIGFMLRQHGMTPFRDATPSIVIRRGLDQRVFPATPDGEAGHYVAAVTFPSDGEWTWSVDQSPFPAPQDLGAVTVLAAGPSLSVRPPAELAMLSVFALGAIGLAFAISARLRNRYRTTASAR